MQRTTPTTAPDVFETSTPAFVPGTVVLSLLVLVLLVLVIGPPGVS
jgi:hypothetical protein